MTAQILNGKIIGQQIKNEIAKEIQVLIKKYSIQPSITTLKIGCDPSSELYLKLRDKACVEVGIKSEHIDFKETVTEGKILSTIQELNENKEVHGILVQYPVPKHISQDRLMSCVTPIKDVEGFHPLNIGKILLGNECLVPCTPRAVMEMLAFEKIPVSGKNIVIVNHSTVVGKPLAMLFLNKNATVSICHVFTEDLKAYTKNADILVSAVGRPKLIGKDHIKENAVVIDVGIVETPQGICGDVDFEQLKEKASMITPVPGGVGPVTIACSLKNMIITYKKCMDAKQSMD